MAFGLAPEVAGAAGVSSSPFPIFVGEVEGVVGAVVVGLAAGLAGAAAGACSALGFEPKASPCACKVGAKKATDRMTIANDFMGFL